MCSEPGYRLLVRAFLVASAVAALLIVSPGASAGPPAGICRHISARRCEQTLGPYAAARFLAAYVGKRLRPGLAGQAGRTLECGRLHGTLWVFQCEDTIEGGGLAVPCRVQALVVRDRAKVFHLERLKESAACKG